MKRKLFPATAYLLLLWVSIICKITVTAQSPVPEDISPNLRNGASEACISKSGVITEIAGSENLLYAVSLNAGVWRSENGNPWVQLINSPRYASVIAADPANPAHVVVGERSGEAIIPALNHTGVWESFDKGKNWKLIFNPLNRPGSIEDHSILAVAFTPSGTLLIGTSFGVGRRKNCTDNSVDCFNFSFSPADVAAVSAFTFSRSNVANSPVITWALAESTNPYEKGKVMYSYNDGLSWTTKTIPFAVDNYSIGFSRGDFYSIAAQGTEVIISIKPLNAEEVPYCPHPDTEKLSKNWIALLYYSIQGDNFFLQTFKSDPYWGNGTGLGGRSRLKVFSEDNTYRPRIGSGLFIYYAFGQDVLIATGQGIKGRLQWQHITTTCCPGCSDCTTRPQEYIANNNDVHVDIWDVHRTTPNGSFRVSTDGGIFKHVKGKQDRWKYVNNNDGLHTHHIHSLMVLPDENNTIPKLAYTTMDNNAWYRNNIAANNYVEQRMWLNWHAYSGFGDADYVMGDIAVNNIALTSGRGNLSYTSFGHDKPNGAKYDPDVQFLHQICVKGKSGDTCDITPLDLQVIQTTKDETAYPLLDVVMLIRTPVHQVNFPNQHFFSTTGGPILIRNIRFLANPDAVEPAYEGWNVVSNNLPPGARAVWVAGGHTNPVYYILTITNAGNELYRLDKADNDNTWHPIKGTRGKIITPFDAFWSDLNFNPRPMAYGPVYVNPYNANQVYVLTDHGVMFTPGTEKVTEFTEFQQDEVLTSLLTASGTYELGRSYGGGNNIGTYTDHRARASYSIAQMVFNRAAPNEILVGSPVNGLFVSSEKRKWLNLSNYLPKPLTQISGVAIDRERVYVVFEGRGIWRITNYQRGGAASYFKKVTAIDGVGVAVLYNSAAKPMPGERVSVTVYHDRKEDHLYVQTDQNGVVSIPNAGGRVVHIEFPGNSLYAPCRVSMIAGN